MANAKYNVKKHRIVPVDQNRLILCGLLGEMPRRSNVVQRLLKPSQKNYTAAQQMHIAATYWTPELPRSWIWYQFERMGHPNPSYIKERFVHFAYKKDCREKYTSVGLNNLQFIGNEEIERYYLRRDPRLRVTHPSWAIPYFNDKIKQGWKHREIAERLEFTYDQINYIIHTLCPKGMFKSNIRNPNPVGFKKKGK